MIGQTALGRRVQARQRDAQHRVRPAARWRAVGHARAAVHVVPPRRRRRPPHRRGRACDERGDHDRRHVDDRPDRRRRRRRTARLPASTASPSRPRSMPNCSGRSARPSTRIFLVQILFYGADGRRQRLPAEPAPVLRRGVEPDPAQSRDHRHAALAPWRGRARDCELSDVLDNSRLRWTLGLGATAGIAAMALVVVPAMFMAGLRFRPAWDWKHPAVRQAARAVELDGRLRRRQPGGGGRRPQPRRTRGRGHRLGVLRRLHVLRAPPRSAGGVDRHHVPTRAGASGDRSSNVASSSTGRRWARA